MTWWAYDLQTTRCACLAFRRRLSIGYQNRLLEFDVDSLARMKSKVDTDCGVYL
jgi:hypothetical protein